MNIEEALEDLDGFVKYIPLYAQRIAFTKNRFINLQISVGILIKAYKQEKEKVQKYEKQLDLDYIDKNYVPIERYNQLEKEIEELKNADLTTVYLNGVYDGEKKVKDKIKAKIEEWQKEKEFYNKDEDREWGQYNNWDWIDSFINELQSLLEKE